MRLRFPTRGPGGRPRLPFGLTPKALLRGLGKLVAVVAAAVIGGLAVGTALAELSGDSEGSPATTGDNAATTQPQAPARGVRVRVLPAMLQSASTPAGRRRQRARLSVHVRVTNRGSRRIVPSRPVLVSDDVRVKTDPNQDTAATNLRALAPGATGDVTLRFETAGAVTKRLRQERRASMIVAGRRVSAAVTTSAQPAPRANSSG